MKQLFKAALVVMTLSGFQALTIAGASASETDLLQYAKDPATKEVKSFTPIKVASRRSRRRNRNIAGGVLAAGVAAIIINEAIRSSRRNDRYYYRDDHRYDDRRYRNRRNNDRYYYDDRSYGYRSVYPGARTCRIWARRCYNGRRSQCRKWNRRCR